MVHATKGYGFLEPKHGSGDVFCHANVVEASGRESLAQDAAVTCMVVRGEKGPQVARILDVEMPEMGKVRSDGPGRGFGGRGRQAGVPRTSAVEVRGPVRFFDTVRGYGFVAPEEGGRDVLVHVSALARSGVHALEQGQRVTVWAEDAPRGLQAMSIETE